MAWETKQQLVISAISQYKFLVLFSQKGCFIATVYYLASYCNCLTITTLQLAIWLCWIIQMKLESHKEGGTGMAKPK